MVLEQSDHEWEKTCSWAWQQIRDAVEKARKDPERELYDLFPSDQVLVAHARVYALAEKYNIKELKALAFERFKEYCHHGNIDDLTSDGLHDAIEVVLETTPESDKLLRLTAMKILEGNLKNGGMYPRLEDIINDFLEVGSQLTSCK